MSHDPEIPQIEDEESLAAHAEAVLPQLHDEKTRGIGWAAASVVAFNAAGLAATLSMLDKIKFPVFTALAYVSALALCFVTGVLYVVAMSTTWDKIDDWLDQLKLPVHKRNADEFKAAMEGAANTKKLLLPMIYVGLLASIASVMAPTSFAIGLKVSDPDNDARCLSIQRDMLSAHARRADDPDLFSALGCVPEGEGSVYAPPTDRERRAGHPLPWGGYPPPTE